MPKSDRAYLGGTGWFQAPHWIAEGRDHGPNEKLVLLNLFRRAGGDDGASFPSVPTIAGNLGISDRTVQRALRSLEAKGAAGKGGLTIETRIDGDGQKASLYRLVPPAPPVTYCHPPGVTQSPPPVTVSHPH